LAILLFDFRGDSLFLIFNETKLKGAYIIQPEQIKDERGFFARTWDKKEFEKYGLNAQLVQCSLSYNKKKGTIRGLHYQTAPYEEAKLVSCTRGKIFDVIIDLRINSKTFKEWISTELNEENYKIMYVPEGCAHGFQTLEDNTEVFYQISQYFSPKNYTGIRWDDPTFKIRWPLNISIISKKDSSYKSFQS